jgi:hypothetical protein
LSRECLTEFNINPARHGVAQSDELTELTRLSEESEAM